MFPTDGAKSSTKTEPTKKRNEAREKEIERGGVDGALAQLKEAGFFDIDKACKYLALAKPDSEHKAEVAKTLNDLLIMESHLPETIYDAAAVWGDSETVKIIADKLAMRPFPPRGAFRAAGRMKNPQFVGLICLQLDNIHALDEATRALQAMGPVAEVAVRTLLTHRDVNMRIRACTILGFIGTEKSIPSLRRAAGERPTAAAAKAAWLQINERVKEKKEAGEKEFE